MTLSPIHPMVEDKGRTDIRAGKTLKGTPIKMRIDKLRLVSGTSNHQSKLTLEKRLNGLKSSGKFVVTRDNRKSKGFQKVLYRKKLTCRYRDDPNAYFTIQYLPLGWDRDRPDKRLERGFFYLETSPQHFGSARMNAMLAWLARAENLGELVYRVLAKAWITRVDIALDLYDYSLQDFHVMLEGAQQGESKVDDGGFYRLRLGSSSSEFYLACYEKVGGNWKLLPGEEGGDSLSLAVADSPRFVRVEVRYQPKTTGRGKVPLSTIWYLKNPLDKVQLYKKDLDFDPRMPDPIRDVLLQGGSIPEALTAIPGKEKEIRQIRRRIKSWLEEYRLQVFDTASVWSSWIDCVHQLGRLAKFRRKARKHRSAAIPGGS